MKENGNYELLYIVHPDLESSIDKITDRVRSFIEKRDGNISYEENWGKRKLAYEIKKAEVGIYVLWYFNAPKKNIVKIEKDMRLSEEILRYLVISLGQEKSKKPSVKKEEIKIKKEKAPEKVSKKETEEARMKKIDEKLDILLESKKKTNKKEV